MTIQIPNKLFKKAQKIDSYIEQYGWNGIDPGLHRFGYSVAIVHQDGTLFNYESSYCVRYKEWLMIFTQNHGIHILHMDDIYSSSFKKDVDISQISLKGNRLRDVYSTESEIQIVD